MGARGLHQRLRHRATWPKALAGRGAAGAEQRRYREESEYFLSRAQQLREHVRPARSGFFQGKRRRRATGRRRPTSTTRASGATSTTTPRPTAGTSRSTRRRTARASPNLYGGRDGAGARSSTQFFATPETATFPGSYGGMIHEMLEARDVRMGQWGFSQPGLAPHPVHVRLRRAAVRRRRRRSARRCAGCTPAARSARATPATRTTARRRPGTCSARSGFYPLQMGSPNYAIGSPLFKKATIHLAERAGPRRQRAEQQHAERLRAGPAVNGRRWNKTYLPHVDARQRRRR